MQFQQGQPKIGGRIKGTPNKSNIEKRETLMQVLSFCEETIREDLKNLPPAERLKTWVTLQQYNLPKLFSQIADSEQNNEPVKIDLTQKIVYRALTEKEIETGEWKNE